MPIIDKIAKLKGNQDLSKHEQLVHGVIEALEEGTLTIGDQLPSINKMVDQIGYARKTIFRAYEELKSRGLIESRKLKGYFVISQETNITLRLALLFFAFHSIQEEFYNSFRKELGERFQIDVFFHHNNVSIFETIMSNIQGKYGMYVVAPIQRACILPLLQIIPPKKLLIVDRYVPLGLKYSYISQEFENSIFVKLEELLPEIRKYGKFVLFFNNETSHAPIGIKRAFERFVTKHKINFAIQKSYTLGTVGKNTLYFLLSDTDLWRLLKNCVQKRYTLGADVGILSYDDDDAKEIINGGITTIATDFKEMAKLAAQHVKYGETTQLILPAKLKRRGSL